MALVDESLTVKELRKIAREKGLKGVGKMKESELIEAINETEKTEEKSEKPQKKKRKEKKELPVANDFVAEFRVGEKIELMGLPFKVKEIRGIDLILSRTDIK